MLFWSNAKFIGGHCSRSLTFPSACAIASHTRYSSGVDTQATAMYWITAAPLGRDPPELLTGRQLGTVLLTKYNTWKRIKESRLNVQGHSMLSNLSTTNTEQTCTYRVVDGGLSIYYSPSPSQLLDSWAFTTEAYSQARIGPAVRADFRRLYPANATTSTCCPSDDNRTKVTNSVTSARSLWWHVGPYFWPADLTRTANPIKLYVQSCNCKASFSHLTLVCFCSTS